MSSPKRSKRVPYHNVRLELGKSDTEAIRGGTYLPPHRMRKIQATLATNKDLESYQRLQWEALRKSINGPINKVNKQNIKHIVVELFEQNIVRGRGLFCRSIMKAQMASPQFTSVYACLVSIINSKIPEIGELLIKRVLLQFKRGYKRNDKILMKSIIIFIGHLTNHQVIHEIVVLQIMKVLLDEPTNDSVEVGRELILQCGQTLLKVVPKGVNAIFDSMRSILQENKSLDVRVQYELEYLFQAYKDQFQVVYCFFFVVIFYYCHCFWYPFIVLAQTVFSFWFFGFVEYYFQEYPAIPPELDLLDEDDIITHNLHLMTPDIKSEREIDVFHYDSKWDVHEKEYKNIKRKILGYNSEDDDDGDDSDEDEDEDKEDGDTDVDAVMGSSTKDASTKSKVTDIHDLTDTNTMNLRRLIYLTIVSSLTAEEMAHKILKSFDNEEKNVAFMILQSCAHERSYRKQFGLLAERLSKLKVVYEDAFDELFQRQYCEIHLLDVNKIHNVGKFFAHLLYSDALDWCILEEIKLSEHDTNPSKRIFIKALFQELATFMGHGLGERLLKHQNNYGKAFDRLFPKNNPKNIRFAINCFTTIGLGSLTQDLRIRLKEYQKSIVEKQQELVSSSDEDSDDSDDSSDSSTAADSSSDDSTTEDSDISDNSDESSYRKRKKRRRNKHKKSTEKDQNRVKEKGIEKKKRRDNDRDKNENPRKRKREKRTRKTQSSNIRKNT